MFQSASLVPPSVIRSSTGESVPGGGRSSRTLLRDGLILARCQNSLDILERRAGCVFQCPFAGILQPFRGVFVCQLQQTHARLVALLLYFVAAENGLDSDLRVAADFTGPVNELFTVPLDMFRGSCQDTGLLSGCYEIANKFAHKS